MAKYDGILLCNKPYRMSSHDVINNLRRITGQKKIGHTGTLDPRATGLLVICMGRATKISQFLTDWDKTYEVEITLGQNSTTYDSEGLLDSPMQSVPELTEDDVENILSDFRGSIKQKVPIYSAVKVAGKRLYRWAREGRDVETPERTIDIKELVLLSIDLPVIKCKVRCSKGTYIRTLAHDIGNKIGCGGYLSKLCRVKTGEYDLANALTLKEVQHLFDAGSLKRHIIPIESVLEYPSIKVAEEFSSYIISGRSPQLKDIINVEGTFKTNDYISLKDHSGRIMAIGKAMANSDAFKNNEIKNIFSYIRVLN
jgi:tRNA pseudouridine55 synthase